MARPTVSCSLIDVGHLRYFVLIIFFSMILRPILCTSQVQGFDINFDVGPLRSRAL